MIADLPEGVPAPGDERVTVPWKITEKGRKTLADIRQEKDDHLAEMLSDFTSAEKAGILESVKRIIDRQRKTGR